MVISPTTWQMTIYDGSCWIQNYKIPNPGNQAVVVGSASNIKMITLVDGSKAFISPAVKYQNSGFDFEITEASSNNTIFNQLQDYMKNQRRALITTHTSEQFTGYIINVQKTYTLSGKDQRYVIKVTFMPEN